MNAEPVDLKFQVGARTLWRWQRRLARVPLSLDSVLAGQAPSIPKIDRTADGCLVTSLPEASLPLLAEQARAQRLRLFVRQRYTRRYLDLATSYDAYMARFSSKTRSTLNRKLRRFAEAEMEVRAYRTPDEMAEFAPIARGVSRLTYQERLLDAGLPDGPAADAEIAELAARDAVRAFLLFREERPVAYLYLPAEGATLIYAYLGYDPAFEDLSPGTVLQLEALKLLMAEGRFDKFDFTEGDGQHKRLFATGGVPCVDVLLLSPGIVNRACIAALEGFDRAVSTAKGLAKWPLLKPLARAVRR